MAKKRIFPKIVWFSLSVILIFVAISAFSDEDEEVQEKTQTEQSVVKEESQGRASSQGLSITDFKFGDKPQKVFKTLKSKGYRPYDFDDFSSDRKGEVVTSRYFTEAYLYEKKDGKFEGFDSSYVTVSFDEFGGLAGVEVMFENLRINYEDFQNSLMEWLTTIDKKCIGGRGYVFDEETTKLESGRNTTFAYKNKNGDICIMHIVNEPKCDFNLTFISKKYFAAERLMFEVMTGRY